MISGGGAVGGEGVAWLYAAAMFWTSALSIGLGSALGGGEPWAWAATFGFLSARGAAGLAWIITLLLSPNPGAGAFALPALIWGGMAIILYQSRTWYGIPERRFARILVRQGGWAILPTAVLDISLLTLATFRMPRG